MTTRSTSRTINSYRFTSNDKVTENLTKRKSIIGALQGFGKPEFSLQYLAIGGGGGGGTCGGGGGGGGGVVYGTMGFTSNPLYVGSSFTASFYYQPSPGTNRSEMQVSSVGSGSIQVGQMITGPGIPTGTYIIENRGGNGGAGNYAISSVLTASPVGPATGVPGASPAPSTQANVLTPRSISATGGIGFNTPISIGIGGGGSGSTDSRGGNGGQSTFAHIIAYGGGGGGNGGTPSNSAAFGAEGANPTIAAAGGQGTGVAWSSGAPYGFVAGGRQGSYGGVSFRPGADNDVRNGGPGDKPPDSPFPGYPSPPAGMAALPNNLRGYGGGGGGAGGWDRPAPNSDNESRGGEGGSGTVWPYTGLRYASGGGGSSFQPTNNPTPGGGDEAGWGAVYNGGDQMFDGGTAPTGAPLPPFGGKSGYGGTSGNDQSVMALKNRGGGGGGRYNGASYFGYPDPYKNGAGPLSPVPYPGGLGGAAIWPADYANPGSPTFRGRNSGSAAGSGGSGVVIIRYPAVFGNVSNSGSPDVSVTPTGFIHYTFTGAGSITFDYNP